MRRSVSFLLCLGLLLALAAPAAGEYAPETDYMARMVDCAQRGDLERGREAQRCREEKIAALGLSYPGVDFDELLLLSRLIYAEAGSDWLDEHWKMAVGEVVLNRVASPEFPDTLREVVTQPGQYYGPTEWYLDWLYPDRASVVAAMKLLSGERVLNEPAVVFQANGTQGSGVFLELRDEYLGSTFLCYSYYMELYED